MSSRFVSAGSFAVEAGKALPAPAVAPNTTAAPLASARLATTSTGEKDTSSAPKTLSSTSPPQHEISATSAASSQPPAASVSVSASSSSSSSHPPAESTSASTSSTNDVNANLKSAAWLAVEAQLNAEREARLQAKKAAAASMEEPSLYAVLQANKAAKQAAFDEAHKIKNQFRALDDDEIDFLDEVLMKKREEERRIRRELEEGLSAFKKAQEVGNGDKEEKGEEDGEILGAFEHAGGRKRRRKGDEKGGLKKMFVKRSASGSGSKGEDMKVGDDAAAVTEKALAGSEGGGTKAAPVAAPVTAKPTGGGGGLGGLVGYGSSDEDDD